MRGILIYLFFPYRFLQQLVTAQANRNRELESQLCQFRGGNNGGGSSGSSGATQKASTTTVASTSSPDAGDISLLLQDELPGGFSFAPFGELASMREEDDDDLMDGAGLGMSPSVGSEESGAGGGAGVGVGVEEERGRRGRDGRVPREVKEMDAS